MKRQPTALTAPWAISQEGMRLVLGVWSRSEVYPEIVAEARKRWQAGDLESDKQGAKGVLRLVADGKGGQCAVVGIQGPLFRHASMFTELSNATSYDAIYKAMESALGDASVNSILLRVNSPGGEADGVGELADFIQRASAKKPVWAYIEGMGASAAYWLASQASHIVAYRAAEVGSIGVRITLLDHSEADKKAGLEEIEIVSDQSPDKRSTPIDSAVKARLQTRANDLASIFVSAVASARGVSPYRVAASFGSGDVLIADKALEAGMIDEVGDFNTTLAALAGASTGENPLRKIGLMATNKTPDVKADAAAGPNAPWTACAQCGGSDMPPSYCKNCMEGDDEDEPDGDEAKAFGQFACEQLGVKTLADARGALGRNVESHKEIAALRERVATLDALMIKRDLRSALIAGLDSKKLSLGGIQKAIGAFVLRGDAKAQWAAAMGTLETISKETVVEAACSVAISADDLTSVRAYVDAAAQTTATLFDEPPRDAQAESDESYATVSQIDEIAAKVRAVYTKNAAAAASKK